MRRKPTGWLLAGALLGVAGLLLIGGPWGEGVCLWAASKRPTLASLLAGPDSSADLLKPFNTDLLTVDRREIRSGGPPKDGIPALENPKVVAVSEADFLSPDARVIGVQVGTESRAYPIGVLNWHEVINDKLGGQPIAVVYCPLCDSISVVDRRIGVRVLSFGVSGLLMNSNVLMYDRKDQALWSQVGLSAISGPHAGKTLAHLTWQYTSWAQWRQGHPDSTVVSLETGYERNYNRNPYRDYFATNRLMFPVRHRDARLPAKARVVGVRIGSVTRSYPVSAVSAVPGGRVRDRWAGHDLVLEIDATNQHVAVTGLPDDGVAVHTFWFAWAAFHPETGLFVADDQK